MLSVRLTLLAVAALAFLGCVAGCAAEDAADEPESAARQDAILGGKVEPGWGAVGMLRFKSGSFGSGSLISPTMVLTAAHVALGNPTQFFYGSPPAGKPPTAANLQSVGVAEIIVHPCYATPKAFGCPGEAIDVALVRLATPVPAVEPLKVVAWPIEILWGMPSFYQGMSCAAVGFGGHIGADDKVTLGTRRSAFSTVKSVGNTELQTVRGTGIATGGDSGGPLVCGGFIIGTVRGSAASVPANAPFERTKEGYERTDLWRTWITSGGRRLY